MCDAWWLRNTGPPAAPPVCVSVGVFVVPPLTCPARPAALAPGDPARLNLRPVVPWPNAFTLLLLLLLLPPREGIDGMNTLPDKGPAGGHECGGRG